MKRKDKKRTELDEETTFADMNVEGFRWYDPNRKKANRTKISVTRKEYWAMVRGMFSAMLPFFLCLIAVGIFIYLLAYLWLQ